MQDFEVPGYVLDRLLGFGGTGEVWAAHPAAGGDAVAVKRLRTGEGGARTEEARQRLRREAMVLAEFDDPHVVRLHRVVRASTGDDALVLDLAEGGSLARVLALRGRLTVGEVVTIAVPLAQFLSTAHRRGILHGDVSTANVLFAADGRPLLADLGVARLIGEPVATENLQGTTGFTDPVVLTGEPVRAASDVYGLAAVCWAALVGSAPDARVSTMSTDARAEALRAHAPGTPEKLADVIGRSLAADPAARPTAADFSQLVWGCAAAQPVRLPTNTPTRIEQPDPGEAVTHRARRARSAAPPATSAPDRRRRRRWRRPALDTRTVLRGGALLAVPVLLAVSVWAGTQWADSTNVPDPAPAEQTVAATDWAAVLGRLDQQWTTAFSTGDVDTLRAVDASGSAALAGDRGLLQRYVDAGVSARGLRIERLSVSAVSVLDDRAVLDVVDRIEPYDIVDAGGAVVRTEPGRGSATWRITLVQTDPTDGAWRIASVARV